MNDYRLILRPVSEDPPPLDVDTLRSRLLRIPSVTDDGSGTFEFGERDEHGVMTIVAHDTWVETTVPRPWVSARGPQVFAIVFMIAEWHEFEVYDPQIDDRLIKETVLQGLVAMRQAQLEAEGRGGPPGTQAHFVERPKGSD